MPPEQKKIDDNCYICNKQIAIWDERGRSHGWQLIQPNFCPGCGKDKSEKDNEEEKY